MVYFFQFHFSNYWPKTEGLFLERITRRGYWSKCNVLYIKPMENFVISQEIKPFVTKKFWGYCVCNGTPLPSQLTIFQNNVQNNQIFWNNSRDGYYACVEGDAFVLISTRSIFSSRNIFKSLANLGEKVDFKVKQTRCLALIVTEKYLPKVSP